MVMLTVKKKRTKKSQDDLMACIDVDICLMSHQSLCDARQFRVEDVLLQGVGSHFLLGRETGWFDDGGEGVSKRMGEGGNPTGLVLVD